MSKAINSPTARLLQSSRLFSLPRPLPQPSLETATSTGVYRASDTATLPYPTHQAIVTTTSSHFRGDWGLKRALPRRATKDTSTPHIRVNAQDTREHITDFESAADHTRTAAKWQQMGIPMITKETRSTVTNYNTTPKSVYDEEVDNTDPASVSTFLGPSVGRVEAGQTGNTTESRAATKWKYDGPWIAGMDAGEFQKYLETKIESRSEEFRKFLFERLLNKQISESRQSARARGQTLSSSSIQKLRDRLEATFDEEQKRLRHDHMQNQLSSEITAAICDFLDLPSIRPSRLDDAFHGMSSKALGEKLSSFSSMDSSGPPSTHPGAGLSHIRTNLVMENHPLYGPQAHRSPVLARVVRPRTSAQGSEFQAKIGVGGVVTNDSVSSAYHVDRRNRNAHALQQDEETRYLDADSMVQVMDVDLERGNHIWVQPGNAHIDDSGRIRLDISRGDQEAIAIKRNKVGPIHEARMAATRPLTPNLAPRGTAQNANFGTSLPDMRQATQRPAPRPRVQGFDAELGRQAKDGQMNDSDAAAKIRSLFAGETGSRNKSS